MNVFWSEVPLVVSMLLYFGFIYSQWEEMGSHHPFFYMKSVVYPHLFYQVKPKWDLNYL